jgi:hypothetical protein
MNHGNATSRGHAVRWLAAPVLTALAATALGAQAVPDYESIHIIRGAQRDTKTEAMLQSSWVGDPRSFQVYRVEGAIEGVVRYYLRRLNGTRDAAPDAQEAPLGGNSSITYVLAFHEFDDRCMDAAPSAPPPGSDSITCRRWRRGKDKKKALDGARLSYEGGKWIEVATFTWFHREPNGELQRIRVEIRDIGLSPDGKQHTPLAQLLIESVRLPPGAP